MGTNLVGEGILFGGAVGILIWEVNRSSKPKVDYNELKKRVEKLEMDISEIKSN